MQIRFQNSSAEVGQMDTEQLRGHFLCKDLVKNDSLQLVYSHYDRVIVGGVKPLSDSIPLENPAELRAGYFLERREIGVINVGGSGKIAVDNNEYVIDNLDCLYIGKGCVDVSFSSTSYDNPAVFFILSAPAHAKYETRKMTKEEAMPVALGERATSNRRTIYKYIHADGIPSCQLVMGLTVLEEGCVWNSVPPHTHTRRMEVYFYFNLPAAQRVMHFMASRSRRGTLLLRIRKRSFLLPGRYILVAALPTMDLSGEWRAKTVHFRTWMPQQWPSLNNSMKKICCFGELLIRVSPDAEGRWLTDACMPAYLGGAELNVANALAKWGMFVRYVTAMPENKISRSIQQRLSDSDLDSRFISFSGQRIGLYYLTQGADLKHADIVYDRANSSFMSLVRGDLDWSRILQDVSWFHFSAISPALSPQTAEVCREAVEEAASRKVPISVDLNYRSKLWKYGKEPKEIMTPIVRHCDVIMGNIWSANALLGTAVDSNIHQKDSRRAYLDHATQTAAELMAVFPKCKVVANTFRFDNGPGIHYYSALNDKSGQFVSRQFNIDKIVDKVGSGDCFMAGLIYGLNKNWPLAEVVNYASAAAVGKLMEEGDSTKNGPDEIKSILDGYEH